VNVMRFLKVKKDFNLEKYIILRDDLLENAYSLFYELIMDYRSHKDYPFLLYSLLSNFYSDHNIDFELNIDDFKVFKRLNFTKDDWIVIYKVFNKALSYCEDNAGLSAFIKLFYSDIIIVGPFGEDFRCLDMDYDFLELVPDEVKKLFWVFDDFFNNQDIELSEMKSIMRNDSISCCIAMHLAIWVNDTYTMDRDSLELFVIALDKYYTKPAFYESDLDNINTLRVELDTAYRFSDDEIHDAFTRIKDWQQK